MEKKVLLMLGHPSENSFCEALLNAYQTGAENAGAVCKTIHISKLNFNVNLSDGYKTDGPVQMEEGLLAAQELIKWADHVVFAYPNWWGFMSAIAKGVIDRVLLPHFAFKNHPGKNFPEQLLKGRSMRVLVTMDTPKLWYYLVYRASQYQILKHIIFGYVGFKPILFSTFGFMRKSTPLQRSKWLKKGKKLGMELS
jgi:NAD(P)H dehydrogenase (quinone)